MTTSKVVHELDSATLWPFVETHRAVLLAVLMLPQSERCETFVPVFQSVAEASAEKATAFGYINVTGNWDAVSSFGISTFPHIMLFQGFDNYKTYKGAFTETRITSYLDRFLQFPVITPLNVATLSAFKSSCDVVIVGYTVCEDPTTTADFETLAQAMHPELVFGVTGDVAVAQAEGVHAPALVVYNNATDERCVLPITSDFDHLQASIRKAALPLLLDLYSEIHEDLLDMGTPFAYIVTETASTATEGFRAEMEKLARQYRQKIQFSITTTSDTPSVVSDMHLQPAPLPAFAIREPNSNLRYPMPASTNSSSHAFSTAAASFTQDFLAHKLLPTIKSESIPETSPSALVKVVGQTYASTVHDSTRDVLLVFCLEICAPCERLYPVLEELAEMYRAEEGVQQKTTVATILHDKNDTGLRGVRAFPTIMMFPARDKGGPVRFLGERTVEGLRGFVEMNRSL